MNLIKQWKEEWKDVEARRKIIFYSVITTIMLTAVLVLPIDQFHGMIALVSIAWILMTLDAGLMRKERKQAIAFTLMAVISLPPAYLYCLGFL